MAFWDKDPGVLEQMEEENVYPPRFLVKVCGINARETVNALICFRGMADGDNSTELLLESGLIPLNKASRLSVMMILFLVFQTMPRCPPTSYQNFIPTFYLLVQ